MPSLLSALNDLSVDSGTGVYSPEGLEVISIMWTKVAAQQRLMYQATWLDRPIIQLPSDILVLQEVIWETKPDVIVETGVAHGGSLILAASILELAGHGKVIGVDVDIRPHNRKAIEEHPLNHRIELIEGDSVSERTLDQVRELIPDGSRIMVALDSNHSGDHVMKELEAYSDLVSQGCYLVAHDGAQFWVWDLPDAAEHWSYDHPLNAIRDFLEVNTQFSIDETRTRFGITSSPAGYLFRSESN
jgi:cephalosporin hydroxylase